MGLYPLLREIHLKRKGNRILAAPELPQMDMGDDAPVLFCSMTGPTSVGGQKKSPSECSKGLCGIGRRPTLPPVRAVPSARPGLTSLFGMGRGVPRRCNHRNLSARLQPRMGLTYSWKKKQPDNLFPSALSLRCFSRVIVKVSGN